MKSSMHWKTEVPTVLVAAIWIPRKTNYLHIPKNNPRSDREVGPL